MVAPPESPAKRLQKLYSVTGLVNAPYESINPPSPLSDTSRELTGHRTRTNNVRLWSSNELTVFLWYVIQCCGLGKRRRQIGRACASGTIPQVWTVGPRAYKALTSIGAFVDINFSADVTTSDGTRIGVMLASCPLG